MLIMQKNLNCLSCGFYKSKNHITVVNFANDNDASSRTVNGRFECSQIGNSLASKQSPPLGLLT